MLRLMSEKDAIRVVGDQYGCPTSTRTLTNLLFEIIGKDDISESITGMMVETLVGMNLRQKYKSKGST